MISLVPKSLQAGDAELRAQVNQNTQDIVLNTQAISELQKPEIYGVEWNENTDTYKRLGSAADTTDFSKVYPWSDFKKVNLDDTGKEIAEYGDPTYATDGSNGQCMVRIPKCYTKRTFKDGVHTFLVSRFKYADFELDPCFLKDGKEVRAYYSTFEGSVQKADGTYLLNDESGVDFNADKLSSIVGAKPVSGANNALNIVNARKLANNRGTGWGLEDNTARALIQDLLVIQFASWNSQAKVGLGVVNKASGTGNESEITGQTADILSGYLGTNGLSSVAYCGIENLWGNIWTFLDGVNVRDNELFLNETNNNFVSDQFTSPYESKGILANANGYASKIANVNGVFATETLGSSSTYITDYYYQAAGNRIALAGGGWVDGSFAGLCFLHVDSASSRVARVVGARLFFRENSL